MSGEKHSESKKQKKRVVINKNVAFQLLLMDRSAQGGLRDGWVYREGSSMDRIPYMKLVPFR